MVRRRNVYNVFQTEEVLQKINKHNKEIIEEYGLELKAKNKSAGTIVQYLNDLKILACYICEYENNVPFYEVTRKQLRNFVLEMQERDMSTARLNRMLSSIRTMYDFAVDDEDYEDLYLKNPAAKIKGLANKKVRDIEFLTREEVDKLYDYLVKEKLYQQALLLALLIDTAARKNEVYQVQKDSIKEDDIFTNEVIGKGGKKFELVYNSLTVDTFKKYIRQRGRDKENFLWYKKDPNGNIRELSVKSLYDWVKNWNDYLEEITGKEYDFNIHSFRHTALELLSTGEHYICEKHGGIKVDLEVLQALANHNDMSTTSSYLKEKKKDMLLEVFRPR